MPEWKAFEQLVALIHQTLDGIHFTVESDVTLREAHGGTHQIDVLLTPKSSFLGPVLISCKSSAHPVGPDHIREWADIVHGTGASAGVVVALAGFTRDAIDLARLPTRRLSLWKPRRLAEQDFAPNELKSIRTELHTVIPLPRVDTFVLDVEPLATEVEGRTLTLTFSAATRERYFLRDANDELVGNLWDLYIEAAERMRSSGTVHVTPDEARYLVFDGHRCRFNGLSVQIDVGRFEMVVETDLTEEVIAYENVITGKVQRVPLPPSMLP